VGLASPRPPDPNEEAPADAAPVVVAAATTTGLVPPPVLSAPARDHPADLGPDSNRERGAPPGPGSPPASFLRGRHLDHRLLGPLAIQTEGGPSRVEVPATADPSLWTVREVESERRGLLSGQTLLGLVTDEERLLILAMRAQTRRWDLEERGRILRARLDRARDSLR
jgi:hypothetical protein